MVRSFWWICENVYTCTSYVLIVISGLYRSLKSSGIWNNNFRAWKNHGLYCCCCFFIVRCHGKVVQFWGRYLQFWGRYFKECLLKKVERHITFTSQSTLSKKRKKCVWPAWCTFGHQRGNFSHGTIGFGLLKVVMMMIAFKGAIQDFFWSPHYAVNCFQHVLSSG